jgi:hypothetical protein
LPLSGVGDKYVLRQQEITKTVIEHKGRAKQFPTYGKKGTTGSQFAINQRQGPETAPQLRLLKMSGLLLHV